MFAGRPCRGGRGTFRLMTGTTDWLLCRPCFLEHKADAGVMRKVAEALDRLYGRILEKLKAENRPGGEARWVADITDFFLYLTLDGLRTRSWRGSSSPSWMSWRKDPRTVLLRALPAPERQS